MRLASRNEKYLPSAAHGSALSFSHSLVICRSFSTSFSLLAGTLFAQGIDCPVYAKVLQQTPPSTLKSLQSGKAGLGSTMAPKKHQDQDTSHTTMSEAERRSKRHKEIVEEQKQHRVFNGRVRKGWSFAVPGVTLRSGHSPTKGLINPAFQCYRNAVLQCLLHTPEFIRYLDSANRCVTPGDGCVFCALRALSLQYWRGTELEAPQQAVIDVNSAMESHPGRNPADRQVYDFLKPEWDLVTAEDLGIYEMNASGQQDAHEYLLGVVNMLRYTNVNAVHDRAR